MRSGFPGFPPEAVAFYRGLARHNTRAWFQPRKTVYDEQVKAPMVQLVTELNRAMMNFAPNYVTDAHKAIYRIYRDTRFSPDKTPYKTQIAASFARRGMDKHGAAGYYFAISHKGVDVGGGIYMPPPETLLAVRTPNPAMRPMPISTALSWPRAGNSSTTKRTASAGFPGVRESVVSAIEIRSLNHRQKAPKRSAGSTR